MNEAKLWQLKENEDMVIRISGDEEYNKNFIDFDFECRGTFAFVILDFPSSFKYLIPPKKGKLFALSNNSIIRLFE